MIRSSILPTRRRALLGALALAALLGACDGPTFPTTDLARLDLLRGDGQQAVAGTQLPDSIVVEAISTDGGTTFRAIIAQLDGEGGLAAPGRRSSGDHPTLPAGTPDGRAAVAWTLGPVPGDQTLRIFSLTNDGDTVTVVVHATALPPS